MNKHSLDILKLKQACAIRKFTRGFAADIHKEWVQVKAQGS